MAIPFACGDYLITMFTNGDDKQSTQQRTKREREREREDPSPSQKSKFQIG
jgi:hypothetical protein